MYYKIIRTARSWKTPIANIINWMSVCTSAWNNMAPTGRIFVEFYIQEFVVK